MAKVGASIGLTIKIFKDSQFEFIRPSVEFSEIDTDLDVKEQLDACDEALEETWERLQNQVNKKVFAEMPNASAELELQVANKLKEFRKELDEVKESMKKQIKEKMSK